MNPFARKRTRTVRIQADISWLVAQDPDSGDWIGVCPALNLNALGETWGEFQECATEALDLFLADLHADGELDAFLRRYGWQPADELPAIGEAAAFDVPFRTRQTTVQDLIPTPA